MKLLSLAVVLAAVESISACGRIYGSMQNNIVGDSYDAVMFDGCQDRCRGSASGFGWSYNTVAGIPCNPGYGLQLTANGHEAHYSTPWGRYKLEMPASLTKTVCGTIRDNAPIYCTSYNFDCWAFTNDCNGCGGYSGSSPKCSSNNGMRKRSLESNDDDQDPNPAWVYNKTIVHEMVKNGTLKLQCLALEVYNGQRNNGNKLQSSNNFNLTALHEKYFGSDSI